MGIEVGFDAGKKIGGGRLLREGANALFEGELERADEGAELGFASEPGLEGVALGGLELVEDVEAGEFFDGRSHGAEGLSVSRSWMSPRRIQVFTVPIGWEIFSAIWGWVRSEKIARSRARR